MKKIQLCFNTLTIYNTSQIKASSPSYNVNELININKLKKINIKTR